MDRKPALWWLLTSRKIYLVDDLGDGTRKRSRREEWSTAFILYRYSSPVWRRFAALRRRFLITKLDCGCSETKLLHQRVSTLWGCPEHSPRFSWEGELE
jgi:hypothetical protein